MGVGCWVEIKGVRGWVKPAPFPVKWPFIERFVIYVYVRGCLLCNILLLLHAVGFLGGTLTLGKTCGPRRGDVLVTFPGGRTVDVEYHSLLIASDSCTALDLIGRSIDSNPSVGAQLKVGGIVKASDNFLMH